MKAVLKVSLYTRVVDYGESMKLMMVTKSLLMLLKIRTRWITP